MAGEVVRIRNLGTADFVDGYGNQPYIIRSGAESIVPFDAMALWLGHPAANNVDPRNRVRVSEFARLRVRYGAYDDPVMWEQNKPKLECYTIEGEPIITVADDPDGDSLIPESVPGTDQAFILARMKQMEEEMAALRAALQTEQNAGIAERMGIAQPDTPNPDAVPVIPTAPTTADVPGTIPAADDATTRELVGQGQVAADQAPRAPARTRVGEDTPVRVKVG